MQICIYSYFILVIICFSALFHTDFSSSLKVYEITGKVSSVLYKGYDGLRNNERVEWNNRYVVTISVLSSYIYYYIWQYL